jgi:predicted esterase/catechol 2,3-dioxygenase-like lactoylglutathione lyase family enzyme
MNKDMRISGIHHITAVTSSAAENLAFYEKILGLRLVKQTVNFDDPFTYHLYYGDANGSPGTILTFFPWQNLPSGKPGAGMVTAIAFAIPRTSMEFWTHRIEAQAIRVEKGDRFGDPVLQFADPHGLPIELIGTLEPPSTAHWPEGPIEKAHAVTGFHSATVTVNVLEENNTLLRDVMGMTLHGQGNNRYRFSMSATEAPGRFLDVVYDPEAPLGKPGGGTVHHIAFRTENDAAQLRWQSILKKSGVGVTDVRDRKYFRSIYFRIPAGVLFEIATDPPGFSVDESAHELGSSLKLPEQYEPMRFEIEQRLPRLRSKPFRHAFEKAPDSADDDRTIVTLHGTGGSENDLMGLVREVTTTSAILSPRGQVLENGMPRFFKRLAANVFDEDDIVRRVDELSDFILASADTYGRNPDRLTALGYSNGANMAAAVILLRPKVFSCAVLIRPMLPLQNPPLPDLHGKQILVLKGKHDGIIPSAGTDRLVKTFQLAGADVTTREINAGHEITARDVYEISEWLSGPQACRRRDVEYTLVEETV